MIKHSIEIDRPAEEVFAYLDQLDRHGEWQSSLVSAKVETDGPTRVGSTGKPREVQGAARDGRHDRGFELTVIRQQTGATIEARCSGVGVAIAGRAHSPDTRCCALRSHAPRDASGQGNERRALRACATR